MPVILLRRLLQCAAIVAALAFQPTPLVLLCRHRPLLNSLSSNGLRSGGLNCGINDADDGTMRVHSGDGIEWSDFSEHAEQGERFAVLGHLGRAKSAFERALESVPRAVVPPGGNNEIKRLKAAWAVRNEAEVTFSPVRSIFSQQN